MARSVWRRLARLAVDAVIVWIVASLVAWFALLAAGASASGAYPALPYVPGRHSPVVRVAAVVMHADEWVFHRV